MKKFLGLILCLASAVLWAAPTTNVTVTHPTTTAVKNEPRTSVAVSHPQTSVQVNAPRTNVTVVKPQTNVALNQPQTTVTVTHPTTFATSSASENAKASNSNSSGGKSSPKSEGSYTPYYKNAKPLGNKGADNIPAAAKLGKGEGGLGQMNAQEQAARDATVSKETQHKAQLNAKAERDMAKVMGNLKGLEGQLQKEMGNGK